MYSREEKTIFMKQTDQGIKVMSKGIYKIKGGEPAYQRKYQRNRRSTDKQFAQDHADRIFISYQIRREAKQETRTVGKATERFELMVGMKRKDVLEYLCETPEQLNGLLNGTYQIDHIVPLSWFKKNPTLTAYKHVWYNLRIIPSLQNQKKKNKIENEMIFTMITTRMKIDLVDDISIELMMSHKNGDDCSPALLS